MKGRDWLAQAPNERIVEKLDNLPHRPGVYLMKSGGKIVYVGKAVSLRNRVRSYFQSSRTHSPKVRAMVEAIDDFEYIVTDSEVEALILESNLIKQHRPWYNVRLRDDKHYPYLKVTNELFPRVTLVRSIKDDGARYFGPYTNSQALRHTMRFLRSLFPIRTCNKEIGPNGTDRPCLNYHIKRCLAPCAGKVSEQEYRKMIDQVVLFLEGRHERLIPELKNKMKQAAQELRFEEAARLRDQIASLEKVSEQQKIISARQEDQDYIGMSRRGGLACVQCFFVRGGKLVGNDHFFLNSPTEADPGDVLSAFVKQYYSEAAFIPKEVYLQEDIEDTGVIAEWLTARRGNKVRLQVPRRGEKRRLMEMVVRNADLALQERLSFLERNEAELQKGLEDLACHLGLTALPRRMECYDISNIQGRQAVGSMVVFIDGKAINSEYRRFKIQTKETPDDFAMMAEVIRRRFKRGLKEKEEIEALKAAGEDVTGKGRFACFPDLVVIDGGKGQLSAAREVMRELGVSSIPTVGLAKKEEEIFFEDRPDPVLLPGNSHGLYMIQRLRDEAHRFAITYHRSLRDARTRKSILDDIPGVGPKRKKLLIRHFGSAAAVRAASLEDLKGVPGISSQLAEEIYQHLH